MLLLGTSLIISSFFIWWLGVGIKNIVINEIVKVEPLKWDTIEQTKTVQALVFRNETVIPAPKGGQLEKLIGEGERVRKDALVAVIKTPTLETGSGSVELDVKAPEPGIVSYRVDGLETVCSPANAEKFDPRRLAQLTAQKQTSQTSPRLEAGQAVFKLVHNLEPAYIYLKIDKADVDPQFVQNWQVGKLVTTQLNSGNVADKHRWQIKKISQSKTEIDLLLSLDNLPLQLYTKRQVPVSMIIKHYAGFIVPKKALVHKDGKTGLYIIYKESVLWQEVEVKGMVGAEAAVAPIDVLRTKIVPNSIVVLNPQYVHEGQTVSK